MKNKNGKPRKKPDLSGFKMFVDGKFNLKRPPNDFNYLYGKCIADTKFSAVYDPTVSVGVLPDLDE